MPGPKRMLSDDSVKEIVNLFFGNMSEAAIGERLGIGKTTVHRTLIRAGVAKPEGRSKPRIAAAQKKLALQACKDGMPADRAADRFGLSCSTLDRLLRINGVSMPSGRPPSCELNHAAFDVLTPETLYWLGFLFTDGSCSIDKSGGAPVIGIGLQERDVGHIEKFRLFLGSTHAIVRRKSTLGGDTIGIQVRSKQIADALARVGMLSSGKPRKVPGSELCSSRDFWRGAVDGDGTVGWSGRYPYISLVGREPILLAFQKFLRDQLELELRVTPCQTILRISTTGETAAAIVSTLYRKAIVGLDRKQKNAREILNDRRYCHLG